MNTGTLDPFREVRLCGLIQTALMELTDRGAVIDGVFSYETETKEGDPLPTVKSWNCTIENERIRTAALTYVMANAPWVEEKDKYQRIWEGMLDRIANTGNFRPDWEGDADG